MKDGMQLLIGDDGKATLYDDTYDITIHCESEEEQAAVIAKLKSMAWIPVIERLPNANGIYIVTRRISDGFEYQNITDACYFDGSNTWHDDTRINHERKYLADVLAWMPLPEPWRGGVE